MAYVVEGPGFSLSDSGTIRFFDQAGRVERRTDKFLGRITVTDWLVTIVPIDESEEPVWWPVQAEDLRPHLRQLLTDPEGHMVEEVRVNPRFACILWLQGVLDERNLDLEGINMIQERLRLAGSIEVNGRPLTVVVDRQPGPQSWIFGCTRAGTEVCKLRYA